MVVYLLHSKDTYIELQLSNTTVARKWLYVFIENLRNEKLLTYTNKTCKYSGLKKQSDQEQFRNIKVINDSIKKVNESIKGDEFPYEAHVGMDWEHSQKIHRAFTTSQITQNTFLYNLSEKQLRELKYLDVDKAMSLVPTLIEKTFDIIDKDKFDLYSGRINHYIHHNEPNIPSQRSDDMSEIFNENNFLYYKWITEDEILEDAGIAPSSRRFITFTREDIEESFNDPKWKEYDFFAASNIFGKPYLETYLEYDSPLEIDVRNVQNVSGEFCLIDGPTYKIKKLFNESAFTDWCNKYKLPTSVTHPIPLGKVRNVFIDGKNLRHSSDRQFVDSINFLYNKMKKPIQVEFKFDPTEKYGFEYKY